ncbi:MAG: hypothetical protein KH273_08155, partial [Lacticaseibacillus paracasei]|nr:hypothetical protein [Lacticaseibacillus paracasei]
SDRKNYLRLHHLVRKRQSQQPLSGLHFPRLASKGFVATLFLITDSISLLVLHREKTCQAECEQASCACEHVFEATADIAISRSILGGQSPILRVSSAAIRGGDRAARVVGTTEPIAAPPTLCFLFSD